MQYDASIHPNILTTSGAATHPRIAMDARQTASDANLLTIMKNNQWCPNAHQENDELFHWRRKYGLPTKRCLDPYAEQREDGCLYGISLDGPCKRCRIALRLCAHGQITGAGKTRSPLYTQRKNFTTETNFLLVVGKE